jgi:type I restriction enzyme S subunit
MNGRELPNSAAWPVHWRNMPLWALFDRIKDVGHPEEEMLSVYRAYGVVKKSSRDDNTNQTAESREIYQLVDDGWLIVNRMKAWQGSVGISPLRGIVSGHYLCFRPGHGEDPRYLNWLLRSSVYALEYARMSRGVRPGQIEIDNDELRGLRVALPSLDEQRRIAAFLDGETARIDALSAGRVVLLTTLGELELARIGEQLCGVDVSTIRRPTGWRWLPSVPDEWGVGPVYAYFDIQLGKMLNAERTAGESQQPYLRNANVHWYETDIEDLATMTFEPHERHRYSVRTGDLLVCEGGAGVAEAAVWDGRTSPCFFQKSLHRVRPAKQVPVEWLMYWLRFAKAAGVFNAGGNLATIPHLTGEQLAEYRIPIPPDGHRRVAELTSEIAVIRKTRVEIASADALLSERRQALITAAVTGRIDVTTARGLSPSGGGVS